MAALTISRPNLISQPGPLMIHEAQYSHQNPILLSSSPRPLSSENKTCIYKNQPSPAPRRMAHPPETEKIQPAAEPGDLESSLLHLIQDHHHKSLRLRDKTEKAKREATKNAVKVSDLLVDAVNGGVQETFIDEKRIEYEIRALASTITRFMKQTDQWLTATRSINTAIKEIGDFENWMKTMEFDCRSINAAIRNIHQD